MSLLLFADGQARGLMSLLQEHWLTLVPPILGFVAIYLLLPRVRRMPALWGGVAAALALVLAGVILIRAEALSIETLLFYVFAGLSVGAGGMMITNRNPVHAALSFALVVLSTCGLFLLQAAPFLMAATIIIYAGAIVVTFLFVIMLAQQEGPSNANYRSREPFLATLAGCVLMASLLCILQRTYRSVPDDAALAAQLREVTLVQDEADIKRVLGDPEAMRAKDLTLPIVTRLRERLAPGEGQVDVDVEGLMQAWVRMQPEPLKRKAEILFDRLHLNRQRHANLALFDVPGKKHTPGHFQPGKLPAHNVAAIGRTMFTDYLIAVELAAMLLLVATIGAIVIAGRKSEELR